MRPDLDIVASMIDQGARVLDLGCGDGALLEQLIKRQNCSGLGVELDDDGFHGCIARGVPVTHGNLEVELPKIEAGTFDVAVLSLTLQAVARPDRVLSEMKRVAGLLVVSFENFGHWHSRTTLALRGRMPPTGGQSDNWYDTPKIHPCSIVDFEQLAGELGLNIRQRVVIDAGGRRSRALVNRAPNLLARAAVYRLEA